MNRNEKSEEQLSQIVEVMREFYKEFFQQDLDSKELEDWLVSTIDTRRDLFFKNRLGDLKEKDLIKLLSIVKGGFKKPDAPKEKEPEKVEDNNNPPKKKKGKRGRPRKEIVIKTGM